MRSVMAHSFAQAPNADIPRSQFNRSCGFKTTMNPDYLIPFFVDEALPGDTFNLRSTIFARAFPFVAPFMDNLFCETFYFAVPYRLVWNNFQKFMGEQTDPGDSTDYLIPQMTSPTGGYDYQTLSDFFGIPTKVEGLAHSSLWHRAYNLIFNEWFRDQDLTDSLVVDKDDGPDDPADYSIQKRAKKRDYFTSARPWPQKGPAIPILASTSAPIAYTANGTKAFIRKNTDGTTLNSQTTLFTDGSGNLGANPSSQYAIYDPNGTLNTTLTTAVQGTINTLRQAFQLQKLYERDARGGTRYIEIIKSHFGVTSPDARLQRPEYLGGGSTPVNVNAVAQTSSTDAETPQGNLAATGTISASGHGFTKSFTEHCLIIGMVNLRADITYQQGLNRMWSRRTKWDFYWPALSHLGEQAILNKEIYAQGSANPTADAAVFGYQERFGEYRYKPSIITGKLRSNDPGTLDVWTLSQNFSALPVLGDSFIRSETPIQRVQAIPSEPAFILDCYHDLKCARPMPTYSVPGLVDHF